MKKKAGKNLVPDNPAVFIIYAVIATALVLNIFIAGFWFGRKYQLKEGYRPAQTPTSQASGQTQP